MFKAAEGIHTESLLLLMRGLLRRSYLKYRGGENFFSGWHYPAFSIAHLELVLLIYLLPKLCSL